ncbi:hypothetical protein L7F22_061012 [Adiantum nelumboides]|nr:hypothetical protein [Adiantum nelumboides]
MVYHSQVQYKRFEEVDGTCKKWSFPILSEFFRGKKLDDVFKSTFGLESLTVRDFLRSVLSDSKWQPGNSESGTIKKLAVGEADMITNDNGTSSLSLVRDDATASSENDEELQKRFSQKFGVNLENLGLSVSDKVSWDALDVIRRLGLESKKKAESHYLDNGLAILGTKESSAPEDSVPIESSAPQVEDIKKASSVLLKHTEDTLKSWALLASFLTGKSKKDVSKDIAIIKDSTTSEAKGNEIKKSGSSELLTLEELEELRKMFGKAESAMEAWAVLASSLGHKSFVKSAFEKLCFLDNDKTDTQVALWRDAEHHRLVIAFRGTEQVKWKDLRTDLMLLPVR